MCGCLCDCACVRVCVRAHARALTCLPRARAVCCALSRTLPDVVRARARCVCVRSAWGSAAAAHTPVGRDAPLGRMDEPLAGAPSPKARRRETLTRCHPHRARPYAPTPYIHHAPYTPTPLHEAHGYWHAEAVRVVRVVQIRWPQDLEYTALPVTIVTPTEQRLSEPIQARLRCLPAPAPIVLAYCGY